LSTVQKNAFNNTKDLTWHGHQKLNPLLHHLDAFGPGSTSQNRKLTITKALNKFYGIGDGLLVSFSAPMQLVGHHVASETCASY